MEREFDTRYVDAPAVSSGFFNSNEEGDRTYDADSISSLFDGLITDGIYNSIGEMLVVSPNAGMVIKIGSGKAWFNRIWLNADSATTIEVSGSTQWLGRIDAVIIEINKNNTEKDDKDREVGRGAHLAILTGLASENPVKPTMLHTGNVEQYPLAYITVDANTTEITAEMIENMVGTDETPFVTGLLEHVSIEELLQQYSAEASAQMAADKAAFEEWFSHLQDELDEQQAAHLQNQINEIADWIRNIGEAEQEVY